MISTDSVPGVSRGVEGLDRERLRAAIEEEYSLVAEDPSRGFHFHTGRPLARMLGYRDEWLEGVPEPSVASFAGTGNPFSAGELKPGDHVVDVGCGAGIDTLIASSRVGPDGDVIGVDMTPAMLARARASAEQGGFTNVRFREGLADAPDAPQASSAARFGTLGITFRARKALGEEEWTEALAEIGCTVP